MIGTTWSCEHSVKNEVRSGSETQITDASASRIQISPRKTEGSWPLAWRMVLSFFATLSLSCFTLSLPVCPSAERLYVSRPSGQYVSPPWGDIVAGDLRPQHAADGVCHPGLPRQPHARDHRHLCWSKCVAVQHDGEDQSLPNQLQSSGCAVVSAHCAATLRAEKRVASRLRKESRRFEDSALFPPVGGRVHKFHLCVPTTWMVTDTPSCLVYLMFI